MTITCEGLVDYVEFTHEGRGLTAEARFLVDITATSNEPCPGCDYGADEFYVVLSDVSDSENNEYPNVELRGPEAEALFKTTKLELHTMYESGFECERDSQADLKMREARAEQ